MSSRLASGGEAFNPVRAFGKRLSQVALVQWQEQAAEEHPSINLHKWYLHLQNKALLAQDPP